MGSRRNGIFRCRYDRRFDQQSEPAGVLACNEKRLRDEGNETVTNCNGLKMRAPDGKMRVTRPFNCLA